MPRCPSCDRENSTGAVRCEGCGAGIVPDGLEVRLRPLLAAGRTIEAIKVYREATGAGLKQAKDAVDGLVRGDGLPQPVADAKDLESTILAMLRRNEKIGAIKLYRDRAGSGLKEAKEAVEEVGRRNGIVPQGGGCAGTILAALALAGGMTAGWMMVS
jgi:ribosomal protein L7/L12